MNPSLQNKTVSSQPDPIPTRIRRSFAENKTKNGRMSFNWNEEPFGGYISVAEVRTPSEHPNPH